jgi:AbrB family looped-hinge helix DNA binding protein
VKGHPKHKSGKDYHGGHGCCGCKVEALVSIDARGQMVLPKDVREKIGVKEGEKLAIMTMGHHDECCIMLVKAERLNKMAKEMFGPLIEENK